MIELYEHNQTAYAAAVSMLSKTGKAAVVHPTGTGKSFIGFKLCEDNPDKKVLWLAPSEYIFKTQLENLRATGAETPQNITFATYSKFSLYTEEEIRQIVTDFLVLDEFHRCGAEIWGKNITRFLQFFPKVPVLGLSATAIRYLDNQRDMADELFDGNIASEMTLGEAIVRGILNPPKYVLSVFAYQKDLERYGRRVKTARNQAVRDAAERYLEALRRALEKADGLDVIFDKHMADRTGKYIVFCANKEHMDEMMQKTGEWFHKVDPAPHIYSVYSEDPEASQSFADFKADQDSTHLRLLYCIDVLNEGIHVEDVSGVILLRPTISPIIYKQQIGRALSASKSKEPVIFDVVMNIENLYSIDSVEEEMRVAMTYYRSFGDGAEIVNEKFRVIDELRDCRELFEKLNDTLAASWETMYGYAKSYADTYGNLDVPYKYKTPDGYSLGHWIFTQRGIYRGELPGSLGKERIDKLNAIGMLWSSASDRSWERFYTAAKEYSQTYGDLRVPADHVTGTGLRLGSWIVNLRAYRKSRIRGQFLTEKRIAALDELGMVWNVTDYLWERNFNAATQYHREHGNLDVPSGYVDRDGIRLGMWLDNLRSLRKPGQCRLTEEQIEKLDNLGMEWEKKFRRAWEQGFAEAKSYYNSHKNLAVPVSFVTDSGFKLGAWLCNQRDAYRSGKIMPERIQRLEDIGMVWQKDDPWETRFALAEQYYKEHGDLNVPGNYTVEGIGLGKWVNEQKQTYRGKRRQPLTAEQISRLKDIGIEWRNPGNVAWEARYAAVKAYHDSHGDIEIPKDAVLTDGRRIGKWISLQRAARRDGRLTSEQIEKLDAVGMIWDLRDPWETGFAHAELYYRERGDLRVPVGFVCDDGYNLGNWIINQRTNHNHPSKYRRVTPEQASRLERIGMVWDVSRCHWEEAFEAASGYFRENGDLNVPVKYKTESGLDLREWIRTQRNNYRKGILAAEYVQRLEEIGMDWLTPAERDWENCYAEARRYYQAHGDLAVPSAYRTETGLMLGRWVERQKASRDTLKTSGANGNQIARLTEIGMTWETRDSQNTATRRSTGAGGIKRIGNDTNEWINNTALLPAFYNAGLRNH